jgi:hypothetical protein
VHRLLVVFALALPLHADAFSDLRTSLGKLTAREPIRATYEVQRAVTNEGKYANEKFNGKAAVDLEGDAEGVRIAFARPLLDQVKHEMQVRAHDRKQPAPTLSALDEISAVAASEAIDAAPPILHLLDDAKVMEDREGTWQGKPVRVVIFRLADKRESNIGKETVAENKLTLLLGPDAVPLAAEHVHRAKFSFLIFKGESSTKRSWHFAHIGDRLVRVRQEENESGSGLGQKGSSSLVATLRVH